MNKRTAVVTGANSGFGRLTAQSFALDWMACLHDHAQYDDAERPGSR